MKQFLPILLLCAACLEDKDTNNDEENDTSSPDASDTDESDTGDPPEDTDTDQSETDTDDTSPEDTEPEEPPPVVLLEGTWDVSSATLENDSCELNNFQNVYEFVPTEMEVFNSSEASFNIDASTVCEITDLQFQCNALVIEESVLLGTATMTIRNIMSGQIIDNERMNITFDVTVESCDGFGCLGVESVLTFPCPVELTTTASY